LEGLRSLKGRDGPHQLVEGGVGIFEHILAEDASREIGIGAFAHLGDDCGFGGIVHLDRVEQGPARLLLKAIGAPVTELTARRGFLCLSSLFVLLVDKGERRGE